jgi:FHS family L-fucose permease-like MFS transporter
MFPPTHRLLFALVTVLFFLWGMSNNLTDILVQQFRKSFELSQLSAQLVQTANFFGYFCMAIPAALMMRRWGYKTGMIAGMATFGVGMVLFWPAAMSGVYLPFLFALFVVGCGASMLETACNPFMAQFGSAETSERRLNFVQSFNPPGTIVGVIIGARFIFSGIELKQPQIAAMRRAGAYAAYLHSERMRVVPTYIMLGLAVLSFALLLSRMEFPIIASEHEHESGDHGSFRALLHYPHLWLAVVANFCNVGAQVATWSALIPYMKQFTGVSERVAAGYLTATLVAMALGRFVGTQLMRFISASRLMGIYAIINVVLLAYAIAQPGMHGACAIVCSSFFLSIMFPTTFALGVKGLGPNTKLAGSFLVMAVAGGAVFPPVLGFIARQTGSVANGYIVPLLGYVMVALYGLMVRHKAADPMPVRR